MEQDRVIYIWCELVADEKIGCTNDIVLCFAMVTIIWTSAIFFSFGGDVKGEWICDRMGF